ncbi:DNA-processing protein DprA [Rohdeia mirabilis]|uniref:DNA-processing protein DprA n=1 Tax=Rohdeia mirabilis TaxID=2528008 RepID=UPI003AF34E11
MLAPLQTSAQSSSAHAVRPITPKAYRQLAHVLSQHGAEPVDLLDRSRRPELVARATAAVADLEAAQVERLLAREVPLATSLDQWQQRSIWVRHRTDPGYPAGWLERLGDGAPVLVWGCGRFAEAAAATPPPVAGESPGESSIARSTGSPPGQRRGSGSGSPDGTCEGMHGEARGAPNDVSDRARVRPDPLVGSPSALAVVGSRVADEASLAFAAEVGRLCVAAGRGLVSGAAIGVDEAAMLGALEAGAAAARGAASRGTASRGTASRGAVPSGAPVSAGEARVVGVVADSLGKAALDRRWRVHLMKGRLVLLSPFDPSLRPRAANLLARNRLIHALGAASLAVASAKGKGGTWSGMREQLAAGRGAVYTRAAPSPGLDGLREQGARTWPEGLDAEGLNALLEAAPSVASRAPASGESDAGDASPHTSAPQPPRQQGLFDEPG